MPNLSERLVQLKKERGLLQKDIAKAVGLSVMGYQRYENGKRQPAADTLIKLADYFNVSLDYLTGRTNYSIDADGRVTVKASSDVFNLDTVAFKRDPTVLS